MNAFTRYTGLILILLILISTITSCEKEMNTSTKNVSLELISIEKNTTKASNTDFVQYSYHEKEQSLYVIHKNTALSSNSKLSLSISIIDDKINIIEKEMISNSNSLELHTISFKIKNLPPKHYKFKIVEPYVRLNKHKLEFSIDLLTIDKGNFHIKRNFYPWGS